MTQINGLERTEPSMSSSLSGRTLLISGGSRGIGLAIAVRAARDGANIVLLAKTAEADPRLPGTIYSAAETIERAGGNALPIIGDVRDEDAVQRAVDAAADRFGGIDIVVNNASAITLTPVETIPVKRYDLMFDVNTRGTFLLTRAALPHLRRSPAAHVLTLSPPLNPDVRWLREHAPYTVSKYGMTMLTLGVAEAHRTDGIAANCLWPRTYIATAAVQNLVGGAESMAGARTPEIVADAAYAILTRDPAGCSGNTFIDDDVLASEGVSDLSHYRHEKGTDGQLMLDLFL
jgi:citronellol/citronellal dehydrogenase